MKKDKTLILPALPGGGSTEPLPVCGHNRRVVGVEPGGLFECMGQLQDFEIPVRTTDDLKAHRKSLGCKSAWDGDYG